MLLITKELAEAVVKHHSDRHETCYHCGGSYKWVESIEIDHEDDCIVVRAKLLLEKEWGVK